MQSGMAYTSENEITELVERLTASTPDNLAACEFISARIHRILKWVGIVGHSIEREVTSQSQHKQLLFHILRQQQLLLQPASAMNTKLNNIPTLGVPVGEQVGPDTGVTLLTTRVLMPVMDTATVQIGGLVVVMDEVKGDLELAIFFPISDFCECNRPIVIQSCRRPHLVHEWLLMDGPSQWARRDLSSFIRAQLFVGSVCVVSRHTYQGLRPVFWNVERRKHYDHNPHIVDYQWA